MQTITQLNGLADLFHLIGKCLSYGKNRLLFEVLQNILPIKNGTFVFQRDIKKRLQVIFCFACGDCLDNLIEIEVGKTGWTIRLFLVGFRLIKQYALKSHENTFVCQIEKLPSVKFRFGKSKADSLYTHVEAISRYQRFGYFQRRASSLYQQYITFEKITQ